MRSEPFDFSIFQNRIYFSLRRQAQLQDNLRELMVSVLGKAIEYSGYSTVVHFFVNQDVGEAHLMVLRSGSLAWRAVEDLALHREGILQDCEFSNLPTYRRVEVSRSSEFFRSLNSVADPKIIAVPKELSEVLWEAASGFRANVGMKIVVVPLARPNFHRLGALMFHGSTGEADKGCLQSRQMEGFVEFGRAVSRLMVRVFTSLYGMSPQTYLPSYYCPQRKHVALMSAQIRHFDHIARILDLRRDMEPEEQRACLRDLVNRFSETVADVVEQYRGRIDQLWGGGLLAVFGEYVDTAVDPDGAKVSSCMRAVQAAAEAAKHFRKAKDDWFEKSFQISRFKKCRHEHVTTALGVAVSFGEVEFDYLGSRDHRLYMTFGDNVSLVKELSERACRTELDVSDDRFEAPILVTQPAFLFARKACIDDAEGDEKGSVDRKKALVRLAGRTTLIPVYTLVPENVTTISS